MPLLDKSLGANQLSTSVVSIIMPAYKAAVTIRQAIQGIVHQTHPSWELWVILDGNDEVSLEIIKSLAAKDSRIRLLHSKKNRGVVRARNLGIRLAQGQWIAFCDADDFWLPEKLEHQLNHARQQGLTLMGSSFWFWQTGTIPSFRLALLPDFNDAAILRKSNMLPMSTAMWNAHIHGKHYFAALDQPYIHEDYAFWLSFCKRVNPKVGLLPVPLVCIRVHENSRSANKWLALLSHAYVLKTTSQLPTWKLLPYLFTYLYYGWLKRRGPFADSIQAQYLMSFNAKAQA